LLELATAVAVGASIDGCMTGLRRPSDTLPFRGSVSVLLTESTRALPALFCLPEDARRRFDDDAMPAIFTRQARIATFLSLRFRERLRIEINRKGAFRGKRLFVIGLRKVRVRLAGYLVWCGFVAGSCGPSFQNRIPDVAIAPSRMIVLPVVVREFEVGMSDERTFQGERTDAVRDNMDNTVRAQATARGAHVFTSRDFAGLDPSVKPLFGRLWRWAPNAALEIAAQEKGRRDFGRHSVGDWRFHGDLEPLAQAFHADTALAVLISDTHETGGRAVLGAMAGVVTYWKQIGAACLVSLHDGRMLWCDAKVDAWGDLRTPATAQAAVRELLAGLDAPPASAAAK
jgi:hypothetical protein